MTTENITYITEACLVTCVVPLGKGDAVLKAARDFGVSGGVVFQGKGTGVRERLGILGIAIEAEKEVVVFMVADERRDILIENLYKTAELNSTGAGFIYSTPIDRAATYIPESIVNEISKKD